jgi:hypothetical protein
VSLLIKKISKNEELIKKCLLKLYSEEKTNYITETPEKFINWFCA